MLHRSRRLRRIVLCGSVVLLQVAISPAYASSGAATRAPADVTSGAVAKRGDRSTTVTQVQQQLIAAGITVRGGADGVFGAGTEAAVKAGDVTDIATLRLFVEGRLATSGLVDAAFAAATCWRSARPGDADWRELDAEYLARTGPPRLRLAARTLGRQLLRSGDAGAARARDCGPLRSPIPTTTTRAERTRPDRSRTSRP